MSKKFCYFISFSQNSNLPTTEGITIGTLNAEEEKTYNRFLPKNGVVIGQNNQFHTVPLASADQEGCL